MIKKVPVPQVQVVEKVVKVNAEMFVRPSRMFQASVSLPGWTATCAPSVAPGAIQGAMAQRSLLRFGLGYLPIDGEIDSWLRSILEWLCVQDGEQLTEHCHALRW